MFLFFFSIRWINLFKHDSSFTVVIYVCKYMTVYVSLNFDMNNLFSNEDYDLIQKLKLQNPEHFQQLVKMHLSFALEINLNEYVLF